ncbi:DUF1559 family PulG-like putative transporter [Gemmata sp.]|uniref:DUF1559 family PulG-like putative transporter n=1 Tax=Gemmata sp. TaxID=1914242 RepID=UPI003F715C28
MFACTSRRRAGPRPGFTLIELLVVVAIIAVLIGLLVPAVQKVREAANRMRCQANLKQLALACHGYHDTAMRFPTGVEQGGTRYTSLFVELLPHVEQQALYDQWDFTNPTSNGGWRAGTVVKTYVCPSHPGTDVPAALAFGPYALTTYGGNGGTRPFPADTSPCDGMFHTTGPGSKPKANQVGIRIGEVTDGTSGTLLLGERSVGDAALDSYLIAPFDAAPSPPLQPASTYMAWAPPPGPSVAATLVGATVTVNYKHGSVYTPPEPPPPPMVPPPPPKVSWATLGPQWWARLGAVGSYHPGGASVALADGSVRFVPETIDLGVLGALSTRAGGEVLPGDW